MPNLSTRESFSSLISPEDSNMKKLYITNRARNTLSLFLSHTQNPEQTNYNWSRNTFALCHIHKILNIQTLIEVEKHGKGGKSCPHHLRTWKGIKTVKKKLVEFKERARSAYSQAKSTKKKKGGRVETAQN